MRDYLVLSLYW